METTGLNIRWLTQDEFEVIGAIFASYGSPAPDPDYCKIVGAFEGDQLVGFMCLQFVAHVEPTWISEPYQGSGIWRALADHIDQFVGTNKALYVTVPDERTAHMCTEYGFTRIGEAYERRI